MVASLQSTFGSAFVGLVVSAVLYGVTILQTYLYYRNYPNDHKILKWMVALLWALDTAHIALCVIAVYSVLVLNFNKPDILQTTTWSMNVQTDFNGLIGLIVEVFYARRVWIVSRNIFLTVIILILSIIHFGLGIVFTIGSFQTSRANFGNLVWVTSVGLGSAAAADMLIGISLCYYLSQSRTGFRRTDNLISTLMKYSLTTGFLTGIIACLVVITFGVMPNNFVYVAFFWLLGKCYVNSVLAALNSRESLREKAHPNSGSFLNLSGITNSGVPPATRKPSLSVNVEITSKTRTDYIFPPPPSASTTTSMVGPSTFSPLSPSMCSPLSPSTS
ncbi:hypothetical protein DFH08DRAFT_835427 [Mycena albidolilacea]|uniref:DUF6534 domain-containing protein n=1 Tax=Mycena albidolilacea TaxID=1033008 RepID=A0AAD7F2W0_9AGAR|nr:hypothetical protein DFH08DRAFT_835427 [Mycena albidolilacea]